MINQNQPTLPSAGILRSSWIKPAMTSILAVGMFLACGAPLNAQVVAPPVGNTSAAQIIDNQLQALGVAGATVQARFSAATAAQLESALMAAIYEFPAPNPVNAADNPGYTGYTPADLTNYILEAAAGTVRTVNAGTEAVTFPFPANSYKTIAPTIVADAIAALRTSGSSYSAVFTDDGTTSVIERITAGAAAILVDRMGADSQTPATIAASVDTLLTNSIALDPTNATWIFQEVMNEVKNAPPVSSSLLGATGVTLFPSASSSLTSLSGTSLTQLEAVDALGVTIAAVNKALPVTASPGNLTNLLSVTQSAIAATGPFFANNVAPITGGTAVSVNQNFALAALAAAPTTIPGIALTEMQAIEALATDAGGNSLTASGGALTSPASAAIYLAPIAAKVTAVNLAGVVQAAASFIADTSTNEAQFAALVVSDQAKTATNVFAGSVLGGVIANSLANGLPAGLNGANDTPAALIANSKLYYNFDSVTATSDAVRTAFIEAALKPVAQYSSAIDALLNPLFASGSKFITSVAPVISAGHTITAAQIATEVKAYTGDYTTLLTDATLAVSGVPSAEAEVINDLELSNTNTYAGTAALPQGQFAAIATAGAGTAAGVATFQDWLANQSLAGSTAITGATNAASFAATDGIRYLMTVGLINSVAASGSTNIVNAYQAMNSLVKTTDIGPLATTVATAVDGNVNTLNAVLYGAFSVPSTNTNGFGNGSNVTPQAIAVSLIKATSPVLTATSVLPVVSATSVVYYAIQGQGSISAGAVSGAFVEDEKIANSVLNAVSINTSITTTVAQQVGALLVAGDSTAADYSTFATAVISGVSNLTAKISPITAGLAAAIQANAGGGAAGDAAVITFAESLTTGNSAITLKLDQVAGGAAAALSGPTVVADAGELAAQVALLGSANLNTSEATRAKIGEAVAFSQPTAAATVVADLLNGTSDVTLAPLSTLALQETLAEAICADAPSAAGSVANTVGNLVTLVPSTKGGVLGTLAAAFVTKVPTTDPNIKSDVANIANGTLNLLLGYGTADGTTAPASLAITTASNNVFAYLKTAAAAAGGNLIAQTVATDAFGGVETTTMDHFLANAASSYYVAQGFAASLPTVPGATLAYNVGITGTAPGVGTTSATKALLAEGIALAEPAVQAPGIASALASCIIDSGTTYAGVFPVAGLPTKAATTEDTNNTARTAIAVNVAKVVPNQALNVAFSVAQTIELTSGLDNSLATLASSIITAVNSSVGSATVANALPKANITEQLGAIVSEVIQGAAADSKIAPYITDSQLAQIVYKAAAAVAGSAYDVVGAAVATINLEVINSAFPSLTGANPAAMLAGVETAIQAAFPTTSAGLTTVHNEAASAVSTYNGNADSFNIGPVTRPETGVTNI